MEKELLEQQRKLDEAMARLVRLRKLRHMLRSSGVKMLKQGLNADQMGEADREKGEQCQADLVCMKREIEQLLRDVQSMGKVVAADRDATFGGLVLGCRGFLLAPDN